MVLAALAAAAGAILIIRSEILTANEYTLLAELPNATGLKIGDKVIMNDSQIGRVLRIETAAQKDMHTPVRMQVSEAAFKKIGPESVAWVERSSENQNISIVIMLLNPGKSSPVLNGIKVKPILGIEAPRENKTP